MNPADVRRWVANSRAVAAREAAEMRRSPLTPAEAFSAAMSLLIFDEACNGSPFERNDRIDRREDQQVWNAWAKLRKRWRNAG